MNSGYRIEVFYGRRHIFRFYLPDYNEIASLPLIRITVVLTLIITIFSVILLFIPHPDIRRPESESRLNAGIHHILTENRFLAHRILSLQNETALITGYTVRQSDCSLTECIDLSSSDNLRRLELYRETLRHIPHLVPLKTGSARIQITSGFGMRRNPLNRNIFEFHKGIDLRAAVRDPVIAPADGLVYTVLYSDSGYGNEIRIFHDSGYATLFAHLQSIAVKKGEYVRAGSVIGFSGNSGYSTGPHLHYEVIGPDGYLNPENFMVY